MSTAILLVVSAAVLTPEILKHFFKASDLKEMMTLDLCKTNDHTEELALLDKILEEDETNLPLAREQFGYYKEFADLLKKDTSLSGVGSHECKTVNENKPDANGNIQVVSGRKGDWEDDPSAFPMSMYGTFFPGYCGAAQQVALENAKNTKCQKKHCECYNIVLGLGVKEVCVTVPYPCAQHTADETAELDDYRKAQLERLEESTKVEFDTFEISDNVKSSVRVENVNRQITVPG